MDDVAIVRVEQFYPFPDRELANMLAGLPNLKEVVWAQDEPRNQGAWRFMAWYLRQVTDIPVQYAGRAESASPATGFAAVHTAQSEALIKAALGID